MKRVIDDFKYKSVGLKAGPIYGLAAKFRGFRYSPYELTIFCFHTVVPWGGGGEMQAGVGGSEEAVINLSKSLAARGVRVAVFCNCAIEGRFDGVDYIHSWRFEPSDKHNVVVLWRSFELAGRIDCKKLFVWLHNVPEFGEIDQKKISCVDAVIAVSDYHAEILRSMGVINLLIWRNGVDVSFMKQGAKRIRGRCLYTSAPDQGLECLLELWPKVISRVPWATLRAFYGWDGWAYRNSQNPWALEWRAKVENMAGVILENEFTHIPLGEIALEYIKSDLWVYPTQAEETSCISAMKAQVAGAVPVVAGGGALIENINFGDVLKGGDVYMNECLQNRFVDCVVNRILGQDEQERMEMMRVAQSAFDWNATANRVIEDAGLS